MDPLKLNPFQAGINSQNMGVNQGVTPPSTQPVSVFQGEGSTGIPKAAHDKFAQGGLASFDVSNCNPFQPESRTAEQGQNLYMLG